MAWGKGPNGRIDTATIRLLVMAALSCVEHMSPLHMAMNGDKAARSALAMALEMLDGKIPDGTFDYPKTNPHLAARLIELSMAGESFETPAAVINPNLGPSLKEREAMGQERPLDAAPIGPTAGRSKLRVIRGGKQ